MKNHNQAKGFTLIELLTVIAIIAILAAILLPVVGSVKQSALASKCSSNIRQSAIALLAHVDDNNGSFMGTWIPGRADAPWGTGRVYWGKVLTAEGYVDDPYVLFCSLWEPDAGEEDLLADPSQTAIWPWAGSHAASRTALMPANSEGPPAHIDSVARDGVTSQIVMLAECRLESRSHVAGFAGFRVREGPDPRFDYRHNDGFNAAFADGHVQRFSRADVEASGVTSEAPWFTDVYLP